jgi:hypothetical protein
MYFRCRQNVVICVHFLVAFCRETHATMSQKFTKVRSDGKGHSMPGFIFTLLVAAAMAPVQTPAATQAANMPPTVPAKKTIDAASANKAQTATIAANDPVITIHGLCSGPQSGEHKSGSACNTVVTKEQFEVIVNALNAIGPPLLPAQRRPVAQGYATTLVNYEAAKKAGVEKDPRFAEVMRLARMRAMGDMYNALMQEKASKVSPQEIETYYKDNTAKFEELTMRRITLPRYNSANLKDEEFAAKASKVAAGIQERAAKGEDFDKLQKEAFEALGVKSPPTTHMAPVRRGIYAAEQEKEFFAMKSGDVTPVVEQASALIIFKLEGRETPSPEQSRDEISRILTKQHLDKQEQAQNKSIQIDYNEQYVGSQLNSGWMPASQLNSAAENNPKASSAGAESPK